MAREPLNLFCILISQHYAVIPTKPKRANDDRIIPKTSHHSPSQAGRGENRALALYDLRQNESPFAAI